MYPPPLGHEHVLGLLRQTVAEGRPAHAYLFSGPEGIGKKLVAVRFAAMLNCPQSQDDSNASCPVCRRICEEKHPDFIIEKPLRDMIRIDRVRYVQSFFQFAPVEAFYRVAIIDNAHSMNRAAQNALLKTLEEPPTGRVLILVTSKPFLLLPTVRSRCRRIRFGPIRSDILAEILERQGLDREKVSLTAGASGGSAARALEMSASHFLDLRRQMIDMLTDSQSFGIRGNLELSAEISKDKELALDAIGIASSWVRDLLAVKEGSLGSGVINSDLLDRIVFSAEHLSSKQLFSIYDELVKASELVEAEINVNRNLIMDALLLRIRRILAEPAPRIAERLLDGQRQQYGF
jgi:DNA polymerase-3 subunit delta'